MSSTKYPFIPSPNFNERRDNASVSILVLHYTVTDFETTKQIFLDPQKQVSAHYVVDVDGSIYQFVDEEKRAWHAGVSYFNGITDVNSNSIGIEIVNKGYDLSNVAEYPAYAYPEVQMKAVIELSKDIVNRYDIQPFCVVGHNDVSPGRKIDPGPHFSWVALHKEGLGLLPNYDLFLNQDILNTVPTNISQSEFDKEISKLLSDYGYSVDNLSAAKRAFQMHFNQQAYLNNKPFGTYDLCMLKDLLQQKTRKVQFVMFQDKSKVITQSLFPTFGSFLEFSINNNGEAQQFYLEYNFDKKAYQIWDLKGENILAWAAADPASDRIFMHKNEDKDEHFWILEKQGNGQCIVISYKDKSRVLSYTFDNPVSESRIYLSHRNNENIKQRFIINEI